MYARRPALRDVMAHQRAAVELILASWRDVERRLADADAGTSEVEWLQAEAARLRNEYRALLDSMREEERTPDGPDADAVTSGNQGDRPPRQGGR